MSHMNLRFDPENDARLLVVIEVLNAARALGVVWDDEALRLVHNLSYTAAHLLRRIITPLADVNDRSEAKEGP